MPARHKANPFLAQAVKRKLAYVHGSCKQFFSHLAKSEEILTFGTYITYNCTRLLVFACRRTLLKSLTWRRSKRVERRRSERLKTTARRAMHFPQRVIILRAHRIAVCSPMFHTVTVLPTSDLVLAWQMPCMFSSYKRHNHINVRRCVLVFDAVGCRMHRMQTTEYGA